MRTPRSSRGQVPTPSSASARAEPGRPALAVPRPDLSRTAQSPLRFRLRGSGDSEGHLLIVSWGRDAGAHPHCTDARRGTRTRLAPSGVAAREGTFWSRGHRGTWTKVPNLPAAWPEATWRLPAGLRWVAVGELPEHLLVRTALAESGALAGGGLM